MNETILAYNLGYRVNKSGELYLGGVPINYTGGIYQFFT